LPHSYLEKLHSNYSAHNMTSTAFNIAIHNE